MSVTFTVDQLSKAAQSALEAHERVRADYAEAQARYRAEHAAEEVESTRLRAFDLRAALTRALKKNGPVYADELIRACGGSYSLRDAFYVPPSDYVVERNVTAPKGLLTPAQVSEIKALQAVLAAADGEAISANELKLLGLKNLVPVFVAAGQAQG